MKKLLLFGFLFLFSCTDERRAYISPDSGNIWDPNGTICEPENLARLQTDFNNCGSCDHACVAGRSDRCAMGECFCGIGKPCQDGFGCRNGNCVASDRNTPCQTDLDCTNLQACLSTPSGHYCIDICEFDDECLAGFACIEGACSFVSCVPEECDAIDNDCDGRVDEAEGGTPLSKFCYSGPNVDPWSIREPCSAGVQVCLPTGQWSECRGEQPPISEQGLLSCDLIDNDCDGCIDGVMLPNGLCQTSEPTGIDVVFAVDTSGSMSDEIDAVIMAMRSFSAYFSVRAEIRFGIVLVPGYTESTGEVYLELSTYTDFLAALDMMPINTGSSEPSYDVVYELANGEMSLNWLEGSARIIILFTDEKGQSYRNFRGIGPDITEAQMCASMTHGEVLAAVTPSHHEDQFDACAAPFGLTDDAESMAMQLLSIIKNPCE